MKVFLERQSKHVSLNFSGTVSELLSELKVNPETVLAVRDGELLTLDAKLSSADELQLLSVISGG